MTDNMIQSEENGLAATHVWASAAVDVLDGKDEYLVFADVPGAKTDDVTVQYHDGELRLEGAFRRVFAIGPDVDVDRINAEIEHGVLRVHLPKKEAAKPRKIPIKNG